MTRAERIEAAIKVWEQHADEPEERVAIRDLRAALAPESGGPCRGWWNGSECRECGRVFAAVNATGRDRCPSCGWTNAQQDAFDNRPLGAPSPSSPSSAQGEGRP